MGDKMRNQSSSARLHWLDALRGFCMILVMLGHCDIWPGLIKYIYSFHIPIFFLLSGMVFKPAKYPSWNSIVKDKALSLLIPYFFFNMLMFSVWYLNNRILTTTSVRIREVLFGALYANAKVYKVIVGATWFLPTLFFITLLFYLCYRLSKGGWKLAVMILVLGVLGYASSIITGDFKHLPWHVNTALTAIVFFYLGYLLMQHFEKVKKPFDKEWNWVLIILLLGAGFLLQYLNRRISMATNSYGSPMFFYLSASCSIAALILLSLKLPKLPLLSYIGQNTMVYLGMHMSFIKTAQILFPVFKKDPWAAFVLGLMLVFAILPFCALFNKVCPFLVGKKKKKKLPEVSSPGS
jgi:acyltransferase